MSYPKWVLQFFINYFGSLMKKQNKYFQKSDQIIDTKIGMLYLGSVVHYIYGRENNKFYCEQEGGAFFLVLDTLKIISMGNEISIPNHTLSKMNNQFKDVIGMQMAKFCERYNHDRPCLSSFFQNEEINSDRKISYLYPKIGMIDHYFLTVYSNNKKVACVLDIHKNDLDDIYSRNDLVFVNIFHPTIDNNYINFKRIFRRKLFFASMREHCDESVFHQDYLPLDMFKLIMKEAF